tara:strand:+ start:1509 stop:1817 length:309 start_codon:yes stop_codon:yes gene_type:complete
MSLKKWTNAEVAAIREDKRTHSLKELEKKYSLRPSQIMYALYSYEHKRDEVPVPKLKTPKAEVSEPETPLAVKRASRQFLAKEPKVEPPKADFMKWFFNFFK